MCCWNLFLGVCRTGIILHSLPTGCSTQPCNNWLPLWNRWFINCNWYILKNIHSEKAIRLQFSHLCSNWCYSKTNYISLKSLYHCNTIKERRQSLICVEPFLEVTPRVDVNKHDKSRTTSMISFFGYSPLPLHSRLRLLANRVGSGKMLVILCFRALCWVPQNQLPGDHIHDASSVQKHGVGKALSCHRTWEMACVQQVVTKYSRQQLGQGLDLCCVACAFQLFTSTHYVVISFITINPQWSLLTGTKRNIAISSSDRVSNLILSITFNLASYPITSELGCWHVLK